MRDRCLCVGQLTLSGSKFGLCGCQLFTNLGRIDNDQRITGMHFIVFGNQHLSNFAFKAQTKLFSVSGGRFAAALNIGADIAVSNDRSGRNRNFCACIM